MMPGKMNSVKRKKIRLCINDTSNKTYSKPKVKIADTSYLVKESLQTNNKDLAKALQDSKFECKKWFEEASHLRKENMALQQEVLHLNAFKKNLSELKENLASSVSLLLDATDNLRNAMVLSNNLSSVCARASNLSFEYNLTPSEPTSSKATPRLRAVHPMVSGFTVQKPNVSLVRIDVNKGRVNSKTSSTRLTSIAASPPVESSDSLVETSQLRNPGNEADQEFQPIDLDPLEGTSSTYQNFSASGTVNIPPVPISVSNLSNNTCVDTLPNFPPLVQFMESTSTNDASIMDAEDMELTAPVLHCNVVKALLAQAKLQSPVASRASPHKLSLISENISSSGRNVLSIKNDANQSLENCSSVTPCLVLCTDIHSKNYVRNGNEEDTENGIHFKCDIGKNSRATKNKTKSYGGLVENGGVDSSDEDSDSDEWEPESKKGKKKMQNPKVPSKSKGGSVRQGDIYEFSSPVEGSPRVAVRQLNMSSKRRKTAKPQDKVIRNGVRECSVSIQNGVGECLEPHSELDAAMGVSGSLESGLSCVDDAHSGAGDTSCVDSTSSDSKVIPMVVIHDLPETKTKSQRGRHSSGSGSRRSARVNLVPGAFAEPRLNKKLRCESSEGGKKKKPKKQK